MNYRFIFGLVFVMMLLLPMTSAIGLAPATKEVLIDNNNLTYDLKIVNENNDAGEYNIIVTGDMEKYIKLSKSKIVFDKNKKSENIQITFDKPDKELEGGEYLTRIIVKKTGTKNKEMIAQVGVASKLIIIIPYDGVALNTELFSPNFIKNKENSFTLNVVNKGVKEATNCKAVVEVFTSLNAKVYSTITENTNIPPKSKERLLIPWTPNVENGNYLVKSTLICDGLQDIKQTAFTVGSPELSVDGLVASKFKLGEISKFDLILSSAWGEVIQGVHAEAELLKDDKEILSAKTESKDVPALGKEILPIYLDLTNVDAGRYELFVTVKYLGKEISEVYDTYMTSDKVVLNSLSGNVVKGDESKPEGSGGVNSILIMVIALVVIVNAALVFRMLKKKNS